MDRKDDQARRGVRRAGWLLILLLPLLALGAAETVVRLLGLEPSGGPGAEVPAWLDRNVLAKESRWRDLLSKSPGDLSNYYRTYVWDRYLFYRLRPDLDIPLTDVTAPEPVRPMTRWVFHTNANGFNGPVVPYSRRPDVYRIVTLGDSSTFGWGVDRDAIYPHLLRILLEQRHPGATIEVANLGVCGYSSLQGRVLMQREALRYHPDLVTISYGSNDYSLVPEAFEAVYERNLGWTGALRAALHHSRAYQVYAAWLLRTLGRSRAPVGQDTGSGDPRLVLDVGPEAGLENLTRMVETARSGGADALLVTNCVPGDMAEPSREAAARTGAGLLNTGEMLERSIPEVLAGRIEPEEYRRLAALYGPVAMADYPWLAVYLTDHCHPNRIGHRLIAGRLATMVEATPSFREYLSRRRSGETRSSRPTD